MSFDKFSVSVPYRVRAITESFNKMLKGVIPSGIHKGFDMALAGGMVVNIGSAGVNSTATVESGEYLLTLQAVGTKSIVVPVGNSTIVLEALYLPNTETTFDLKLILTANVMADHVILADFVVPANTTTLSAGMVSTIRRREVSLALNSETNDNLSAMQSDIDGKIDKTAINTSLTSASSSTVASSSALKIANDTANSAKTKSNDSFKLEGRSRAQIIAEARSGLSPNTDTHRAISDSVTSIDQTISASLLAVKKAYDKGEEAMQNSGGYYLKRKSEPRLATMYTLTSNPAWVTLLNITGEVLLLDAYVQQTSSAESEDRNIRITLDGELLPALSSNSTAPISFNGFNNDDHQIYAQSSLKIEMQYSGAIQMYGSARYVLVQKTKF